MTPSPAPIRLLLVDDHAVVRAGLNAILGADPRLAIVGAVATVAEVLPAAKAHRPEVVLLDVRLPDGSGTTLVRELKALPTPPRVAMLTSFAEPVEVFAALDAGVDGYLLKDSDADALVAALVAIAAGQQVLHPQIRPLVLGGPPANDSGGRLTRLTGAERRILALVTEGRTNKEIAEAVGLAEKTVRNQMTVILSKLGVERRQQAVALFVEEQATGR
jgi:DNA-binding NarL/FixJ family response regulator